MDAFPAAPSSPRDAIWTPICERLPYWRRFFASNDAISVPVRTTIALDDDLMAKAEAYTGLREKSSLIREALKALIERESARRLALLGGSQPDLVAAPRMQSQPG
jgi:Arc/MetJ family transcription regulator